MSKSTDTSVPVFSQYLKINYDEERGINMLGHRHILESSCALL